MDGGVFFFVGRVGDLVLGVISYVCATLTGTGFNFILFSVEDLWLPR